MRFSPLLRLASLCLFAPIGAIVAFPVACSSAGDAPSGGDDASVSQDEGPDLEPPDVVFESNDPFGRVLLLHPYHLDTRCYDPATAIGHFDSLDDGGIAPCIKGDRCYLRIDGVVIYAPEDCIHGTNFLMNVESVPYSDLGPCEPAKHADGMIKDCPNNSCTWARDAVVDVARGCATALSTKGCREVFGAPTACFCAPSGEVFVAANPKASPAPPAGFTACSASSDACKKALALVDTVGGCVAAPDAGVDGGGGDAKSDAVDADDAGDAGASGADAVDGG